MRLVDCRQRVTIKMSRHPAFIGIIFLALISAGCAPTLPAVQNSVPTAQVMPATQLPTSAPTTAATTTAEATPTSISAAQPAPVMSADEVYKAVSAAWTKLEQAGPRHVSQKSFKGDTATMNIEADSVPPNYHQVVSVGGSVMAEQYVYGGTIYNKVKGEWSQLPGAGKTFKSTLAGFAQAMSDQILKSDGKVVGMEDVNGKPAIVYSYTTTLKGTTASTQYTVSVDQASGLLVKQTIINPEGIKTEQTITYDAGITLTLPDEAKNSKTAN